MAIEHQTLQDNTARLVSDIVNGYLDGPAHIRAAFDNIGQLITSKNQKDIDSGLDSLHVLYRFLDKKHSSKL